MILTTVMAHPRKLIRQAVVALLAGATVAGTRVAGTRVEPHKKSQLPAIGVYTLNDPVDDDASSEVEETHEVELEIAGWVLHTDAVPVDDAMDDLAEQIEETMKTSPYLGGKAGEVRLVGTTMEVLEDDARTSPIVGIIVLTYAVTYHIDRAAPASLDDFRSVDAKHRIVGAVEANQARDTFVVKS